MERIDMPNVNSQRNSCTVVWGVGGQYTARTVLEKSKGENYLACLFENL